MFVHSNLIVYFFITSVIFVSSIFVTTSSCITAVMSFVLIFLQIFVFLVDFGKDLFALLLLIIYVGAIAVLFLFTVMTTNIDRRTKVLRIHYNDLDPLNKLLSLSYLKSLLNASLSYGSFFHVIKNSIFFTRVCVFGTVFFAWFYLFYSKFVYFVSSINLIFVNVFSSNFEKIFNWSFLDQSLKFYEPSYVFLNDFLLQDNLNERLFFWCGSIFTDLWGVLYIIAFILFIATIGVIDLVLPKNLLLKQ